ncbi:NAD(P)H-binding protein [uncultured Croceicoccus sp.]|uniref:NmrA family NAD(P)-binding protein n=1 Tax=uncultured Croceicoccus sp. TaxID=1295329 RepID=UPI00262C2AAF|nr:NAD(P)H-binding protein [uncultured Croceicoccus sp.]
MYFGTGITGHVGGATARAFLARGKSVRSLVRDPETAAGWKDRGVDLHRGDLTDPGALSGSSWTYEN